MLEIAGKKFDSRLIMGTGGASSQEQATVPEGGDGHPAAEGARAEDG